MKHDASQVSKAAEVGQRARQLLVRGTCQKACQLFLKAARMGDEEAQVCVGYDYAYGIWGKVKVDRALYWWKLAYKQGSWAAAFQLGAFYREERQWQKAVKWFERAVEAGDDDGLIEIAKIHLRYAGDRAAGLRYLDMAVAARDTLTEPARLETDRLLDVQQSLTPAELLYMEADLLNDDGRCAEALPLLEKGAELGDASARLLLANYLSDGGEGVPMDRERAVKLYKQLFEQGETSAGFNLAMHYLKLGETEKACRWFEKTAEGGDDEAHLALAKIWLHDRENKSKAIEHLKAVFQNNPQQLSGMCRDEAREMLRRLQSQKDHQAMGQAGPKKRPAV